jgi:hypothetical protein
MLFNCPECDCGYIEVTLVFNAKYKENDADQDYSDTWLVASKPIDKYEVEWFRVFKKHVGDDSPTEEE